MIEIISTDILDDCKTPVFVRVDFIKWIVEESDGAFEFSFNDGKVARVQETLDEIKAKLAADTLSGEWQVGWLELRLEENGKPYRILLHKALVSLFYRDGNVTKVETYEEGAMTCPVFHALNEYEDVKAQMQYTYSVARQKKIVQGKNPDVGI